MNKRQNALQSPPKEIFCFSKAILGGIDSLLEGGFCFVSHKKGTSAEFKKCTELSAFSNVHRRLIELLKECWEECEWHIENEAVVLTVVRENVEGDSFFLGGIYRFSRQKLNNKNSRKNMPLWQTSTWKIV